MEQKTTRNSSIEALKLFGIFSIVVSHVVLTLETRGNTYVPFDSYVIDLSHATNNIQYLVASMLRYGGEFGNTVFFICSAWFLIGRDTTSKKKILSMLADVWVVSVSILAVVLTCNGGHIKGTLILQSLFPTTFENNWYITCYIIFYIIHPLLNKVVFSLKQKTLLRLNTLAIVLYFFIAFICRITQYMFGSGTEFFSSRLVMWAVVYCILAYMKLYAVELTGKKEFNVGLICFGVIGNCGLILLTNIIGLKFGVFSQALQIWIVPYNPFIIALGIGLLGLARSISLENRVINYISGLSLMIYIIHENKLLRLLYRPVMWQYVYEKFGYEHILFWIIVLSVVVFIFALACSIVYFETVRKLTVKACNWIYESMSKMWNHIETTLLRIN